MPLRRQNACPWYLTTPTFYSQAALWNPPDLCGVLEKQGEADGPCASVSCKHASPPPTSLAQLHIHMNMRHLLTIIRIIRRTEARGLEAQVLYSEGEWVVLARPVPCPGQTWLPGTLMSSFRHKISLRHRFRAQGCSLGMDFASCLFAFRSRAQPTGAHS